MRTMDTPAPKPFRSKLGSKTPAQPRVAAPAPLYAVTSRFASAESAAAAACILLAQPALWECLHAAAIVLDAETPEPGSFAAALADAGITSLQIEQADTEARALDAALRSWVGWVHADNKEQLREIAATHLSQGRAEKPRAKWWKPSDLERASEQAETGSKATTGA